MSDKSHGSRGQAAGRRQWGEQLQNTNTKREEGAVTKGKKIPNILVLPGDGIGVSVCTAAIPVLNAMAIPLNLHYGDIGWSFWQQEGKPVPERTWQLINNADAILLGATHSEPQREAFAALPEKLKQDNATYVSPIIQLRQKLDLYANIRPCFDPTDRRDFNFCIIRENTEGLYAGLDYYPLPDSLRQLIAQKKGWQDVDKDEVSCALRLQSRQGLQRIFDFAFHYAKTHKMQRVTLADKANVLRQSGDFARQIFEETAHIYPAIEADIRNVDAVALQIVRRPEQFGVIVAENMFGDILSDVAAGIMGGLGLAPSANIGEKSCYFEPVHGSGPRMEADKANPCAMFLSIAMMLEYLSFDSQAAIIRQAVKSTIKDGRFLTYDLGGKASTIEMANAIIDQCLISNSGKLPAVPKKKKWQQLSEFSAAELSDVLDACGTEGVLTGIKPLGTNHKLIGPAYTISYASYDEKPTDFQGAADYIDAVPADAVIVIDNQGREDCTVWGDIMTRTALLKNIGGTVVNGAIRDIDFICNTNYPVYGKAVTMRSGKNRVYKRCEQSAIMINNIRINPDDIIFADAHGVLVIPAPILDEVLIKARNIKETEQKIMAAVKTGISLQKARKLYQYDKPWINREK